MRTMTSINLDTLKGTGQCEPADSPSGVPSRPSRTKNGLNGLVPFSRFVTLLWFVLLSGCAVGPNYQRPKLNVPSEYRSAEGATDHASIAYLPWWEVFKDAELKHLVQ